MAKFEAHLKCSFCGKAQDQVRKLIAGPGVYICDECIDLCTEILDEELIDTPNHHKSGHEQSYKSKASTTNRSKPAPTLASIPNLIEMKKFLDDQIVWQEPAKKVLSVSVYNHYKRRAWKGDVYGEADLTRMRLV